MAPPLPPVQTVESALGVPAGSLAEAAGAIAASVGAGVGGLSPLRCLTLYLERLSPRCADPACLPLVCTQPSPCQQTPRECLQQDP